VKRPSPSSSDKNAAPFRLRRLFDPRYALSRLKAVRSPRDLAARLGNVMVYTGGLAKNSLYRARGFVPGLIERWRFPEAPAAAAPAAEKAGSPGLDAVLIQCPAWGVACPPYGIAVLKPYLAAQGFAVRTLDLNIRFYTAAGPDLRAQWDPSRHQFWMDPDCVRRAFDGELASEAERIVDEIVAANPRVVGFSTLYSNEQSSLLLARRIKARLPRCLVVFGGPQASKDAGGPKQVLSGVVDFAVEGEGELVFSAFLRRLKSGEDPALAPGLLFARDGRAVDTGLHPLAPEFSSFPFPDYSDFPMDDYQPAGTIPVSLSRGCPNDCAFCYEVQYWKRFRVRKAESLVAEVVHLKGTLKRVDHLWFHDSLINGHMGEMKKFAQGLIDAGVPTMWSSQAVIRKEMTRDVLDLLKASGCVCLNYGLESASFATMLKMGKHLAKGADLDAIVRDTTAAGIDCILNFMFGFPGETEEDFQISLDFVRRNKDHITMVQPSPGFCDFYQGTEGFKNPEKYGIDLREGSAHWTSKDGLNTYLTRMARFERFLAVIDELGLKCSYPYPRVYLKNTIIGNYHFTYGQYAQAIPFLEEASRSEPPNRVVAIRLEDCYRRTRRPWRAAGARLRRWNMELAGKA
jgi:radical SAM superfamily enzyme YgiQ (UPF0313 family)